MRTTLRQRVRQRAAAAAAANRPDLSRHLPDDVTAPVTVAPSVDGLTDWPEVIRRSHPNWWQVHRVELDQHGRTFVLIAECQTEREAFDVAGRQLHQVRITKWNSRARPYFSLRDPLDRRGGGDDA